MIGTCHACEAENQPLVEMEYGDEGNRKIALVCPRCRPLATMANRQDIVEGVLAVIGWRMRGADYQVVAMLAADGSDDQLIDVAAEYAWDHILGEPDEPTAQEIAAAYRKAAQS